MARQRDKFETQIFQRSGSGKWIIRRRYRDRTGNLKTFERTFDTKQAAKDYEPKLKTIVEQMKRFTGNVRVQSSDKFSDLAELARREIYAPATIDHEGYKVSGVRSYRSVHSSIAALEAFFGDRRLSDIHEADLTHYREWRIEQGSRTKDQKEARPIQAQTAVLDLKRMAKMWRWAIKKKGLVVEQGDIFAAADAMANRVRTRKRLLTREEQHRLLMICEQSKCDYLKAAVLIALDSGLRREEIFKLKWQDINIANQTIFVVATNTKTETARVAPLTSRAIAELSKLKGFATRNQDDLVMLGRFPRRQWELIREKAGVVDLQFRDLRANQITTLQRSGISEGIAGMLAGHADPQTTRKFYTSSNEEVAGSAAETLDAYLNEQIQTPSDAIN